MNGVANLGEDVGWRSGFEKSQYDELSFKRSKEGTRESPRRVFSSSCYHLWLG